MRCMAMPETGAIAMNSTTMNSTATIDRPVSSHRSVLASVPARPLSAPSGAARGGAGGLARAVRNMGDGPASGGPRRAERLADLLFLGRRRLERFPQGAAVASAEHHSGSRPAAAYPDPCGADAHPVAGRDQRPARQLCARGGSAGRSAGRDAANSTASPIWPRPTRSRCFRMRSDFRKTAART